AENRLWHAAAFSPDGRRLLTIRQEDVLLSSKEDYFGRGEVRVWDAADGTALFPPVRPPGGNIVLARFSPGGRFLVTAVDRDGFEKEECKPQARVWDAATGQPAGPPLPHDTRPEDVR